MICYLSSYDSDLNQPDSCSYFQSNRRLQNANDITFIIQVYNLSSVHESPIKIVHSSKIHAPRSIDDRRVLRSLTRRGPRSIVNRLVKGGSPVSPRVTGALRVATLGDGTVPNTVLGIVTSGGIEHLIGDHFPVPRSRSRYENLAFVRAEAFSVHASEMG